MTTLRVATYNIHGAVGLDRRHDIGRVARVVTELDADVVALQEVESRQGDDDPLTVLERQTRLRAVAGPTLLRGAGAYGNALMTRGQFVEVRRLDLSVRGREPRGALDAVLDCRGVRLRVLATHLGLRPAERRQQIRALLARLAFARCATTVLMGDLNEWFLWGRPLRWLRAEFRATPAPATFPSRLPLFALDRVWVRPRDSLRSLGVHATATARLASDHLPLLATIEL